MDLQAYVQPVTAALLSLPDEQFVSLHEQAVAQLTAATEQMRRMNIEALRRALAGTWPTAARIVYGRHYAQTPGGLMITRLTGADGAELCGREDLVGLTGNVVVTSMLARIDVEAQRGGAFVAVDLVTGEVRAVSYPER